MMTKEGKLAVAALGVPGLTLPRIGIFSNNISPNENSVYADFTLATYTGYANVTPTVGAIFVSQAGDVSAPLSEAVFLGPTAGAGVDAYGWFLFDNVTHSVWACERFSAAPLSLQNLLDRLAVDIILQVNGSSVSDTEN
jgi:hypothetical protein